MDDQTFVAYVRALRQRFEVARTFWARRLNERDRPTRERLGALALKAIRDDRGEVDALEFKRDEDTSGVISQQQQEPPTKEIASRSLAGELAIALWDEFFRAKRGGFCGVCNRPWLSPLDKTRQICGRPACVLAWRKANRTAEDPAKVYERVKRYRARLRAQKEAGRGKARKR